MNELHYRNYLSMSKFVLFHLTGRVSDIYRSYRTFC
jgi:hypothetical protein